MAGQGSSRGRRAARSTCARRDAGGGGCAGTLRCCSIYVTTVSFFPGLTPNTHTYIHTHTHIRQLQHLALAEPWLPGGDGTDGADDDEDMEDDVEALEEACRAWEQRAGTSAEGETATAATTTAAAAAAAAAAAGKESDVLANALRSILDTVSVVAGGGNVEGGKDEGEDDGGEKHGDIAWVRDNLRRVEEGKPVLPLPLSLPKQEGEAEEEEKEKEKGEEEKGEEEEKEEEKKATKAKAKAMSASLASTYARADAATAAADNMMEMQLLLGSLCGSLIATLIEARDVGGETKKNMNSMQNAAAVGAANPAAAAAALGELDSARAKRAAEKEASLWCRSMLLGGGLRPRVNRSRWTRGGGGGGGNSDSNNNNNNNRNGGSSGNDVGDISTPGIETVRRLSKERGPGGTSMRPRMIFLSALMETEEEQQQQQQQQQQNQQYQQYQQQKGDDADLRLAAHALYEWMFNKVGVVRRGRKPHPAMDRALRACAAALLYQCSGTALAQETGRCLLSLQVTSLPFASLLSSLFSLRSPFCLSDCFPSLLLRFVSAPRYVRGCEECHAA